MKVEILTPNKCLFKGEAKSVSVPSTEGPFMMLEHHAPIVAILEAGNVTLTDLHDEQQQFAIKGGFCEQHDNHIIICAEL